MNRRDLIKALPAVGIASLIPKEGRPSVIGEKIKFEPVNPKGPLETKKLSDYRKFFEFITLDTYEADYVSVDIPVDGTPSMEDYVKVPFYKIGSGYDDVKLLKEFHNRKVISDIEGVLAATLSDIGDRDVNSDVWEGPNKPLMLHYILDFGRFDGANHIDLDCPQVWEVLIPQGVKLGKCFRASYELKQDKEGAYSTEKIAVVGFNTHIFARPYKGV